MTQPWVLMVSGSSSSGKTSLCRALLPMVEQPTVLLEADRTFPEIADWSTDLEPAILLFHRAARTWWDGGVNVIIDGALPYDQPALRARCVAALPSTRTRLLAVTCATPELRRRERSRPDPRPPGWAERQAADIHDGVEQFATVDTSSGTPDEHARSTLDALRRRDEGGDPS